LRKNTFIGWIIAVPAAALVLWLGYDYLALPDHADPDNRAQTAFGNFIYDKYCASCHGRKLEGQADWRPVGLEDRTFRAPPHDETGHSWHHSDQSLFEHTKRGGKAVMPPGYRGYMKGFEYILTDVEIWSVLAYIKSRWPPAIRARQEEIDRQIGPPRRR
jgi:mono/diheme cytochrome c family protein